MDSPFLFTARPFDPDTGLQSNLNRWYDPAVGRWLREDPIGLDAADGNLYRYCGNSALLYADPTGLQASIHGAAAHAAAAGWTAEEIATTFAISSSAAAALVYHAEITKAAESIVQSLTRTAAEQFTDPCEAARAAIRRAERGIKSFEKRIAEHEPKIADPLKYMTHPYAGLTPEQNIKKAIEVWRGQIAGFRKNIEIYNVVLKKLKVIERCACRRWYNPWTW